jgi:hypothetical protein
VRLVDLEPRWVTAVEGRDGMGISFECPCCRGTARATRLAVYFANPIDGGPPADDAIDGAWNDRDGHLHHEHTRWTRTGVGFTSLTLAPSVDASGVGHWHGFITDGVAS